ncbi:hypothetical protein [Flavobacterium sp.]|jgi:hypothetical protein|uniref:hypothetical protein n=1 Tax=Flavobacterium sp. TaxID=239 RepID=UPI002A8405E3|nr:hypothetical protein [Flavobacterium sp.]
MKKLLIVLMFIPFFEMYSQGCSDAGICTVDNMKSHENDSIIYKNAIKIGVNYGISYENINIFGSYIAYNRKILNNVNVDLKLTYFNQFTSEVSSSALSDAIISSNIRLNEGLTGTIGFKIPFTDGNLKENGAPLPMDFQPSLGTFDVILGVSKRVNKFNFVLGYQQPLTQNKNEFIAPPNSRFSSTNNYKRAGDLLFRAVYNYQINDRFTFSPSLLPIYHIAEDKYTDLSNIETSIDGSAGLTLNANLYFNYKLSDKKSLEFSLGGPLLVREVRPDGLTRGIVVNVQYKFLF